MSVTDICAFEHLREVKQGCLLELFVAGLMTFDAAIRANVTTAVDTNRSRHFDITHCTHMSTICDGAL